MDAKGDYVYASEGYKRDEDATGTRGKYNTHRPHAGPNDADPDVVPLRAQQVAPLGGNAGACGLIPVVRRSRRRLPGTLVRSS